MSVKDRLDTFASLKQSKERIYKEGAWEEIDGLFGVSRNADQNEDMVMDGGPQLSLQTFKTGMVGRLLLSPQLDFFTFGISDEDLMDQREVRMWMSKAVQGCKGLLRASNLYTQMAEFFAVWGRLGTASVYGYWDEVNRRMVFLLQDTWSIYLAESDAGEVDTVYRFCTMTAQKLVQRFGRTKVHPEVLEAYDDPQKRFHEFRVLHAVEPNPKYDPRKKDAKSKRFLSDYIDVAHEYSMKEGGYSVMPYATGRADKLPGEVYGRGPGFRARKDIKSLYAYMETDLTATQLAVNPPLGIPEELRGKVPWVPGGRYYYEDAGRVPREPERNVDLRAGVDRELRKQQIIDQHLLVPQFTMMQRLGLDQGDKATLGHVARIEEEIAVHLGPQVAGIGADVFDKIVDFAFDIAWDEGLIPPPPRVLVESQNGKRIDTIYLGPLAQAQRRSNEQEPYRRALANIAAMLQMDPSGQTIKVLDNYDLDRISREMSKADGLPEESLLEEKTVAKLREARAKAAQEQQQMAAMETMGKPGMTKQIEPGSIVDKMSKAKQATAVAP